MSKMTMNPTNNTNYRGEPTMRGGGKCRPSWPMTNQEAPSPGGPPQPLHEQMEAVHTAFLQAKKEKNIDRMLHHSQEYRVLAQQYIEELNNDYQASKKEV